MNRPGLLTAVCVVALAMGGLGLLTALTGFLSLASGEALQQSMQNFIRQMQQPMPGNPAQQQQLDKLQEIQTELQETVLDTQKKWRTLNLATLSLQVVLCVGLIVGGIGSLQGKSWARMLLMIVLPLTAVFELARGGFQVVQQMELIDSMRELMAKLVDASLPPNQQAPPQFRQMMHATMMVSMTVGIATTVVFMLAKVIGYLFGTWVLRSSKVREWFALQDPHATPARFVPE